MKIGFVSLGCSKNLVDSERIMGVLRANGHTLVQDPAKAQAIFINTCGFIESAKEEAIATIFEMAQYKQKGSCEKLIVTGCLAQRYTKALQEEIPEIDAVIAIRDYERIDEILKAVLHDQGCMRFWDSERVLSSRPWSAYLKIAEGCSNHCTYCAIPLIRGDNVSYPLEQLIAEAKQLAGQGVKELVLIAQDTTKYGVDLYGKGMLLTLLEQLEALGLFHWIRVLYMYPDEIDEALIKGMAKLPHVLPYFDIPLQHANDEMLRKMNRRGTIEEVKKTIALIRDVFAHPTIRTTFIVGFPQEESHHFEELLAFMKEMRFDRLGAFPYSKEEDTAAYGMDGQIDEAVKQERLDRLMALQKEISKANMEAHIGEVMEVLVEKRDGLSGAYRGRGYNSAPDGVDGSITFQAKEELEPGCFVKVRITEAGVHDLYGEQC